MIARRRGIAFLHHVEVVIEGGHFVHLGHRHLHFGGERDEMRRREAAEMILNQVQELDQQIRRRGASPSSAGPLLALLDRPRALLASRARVSALPLGKAGPRSRITVHMGAYDRPLE